MNFAQRWIAFRTLLIKEIRRILRIWPQTLLPPVITMSLYFVIFGKMIGPRVGEMGGVPYMQFIVPGLIMMAIITNSYSNVVSSFFSAKFHSSIEELLVSPISKHAILTGYISGGISEDWQLGSLSLSWHCSLPNWVLSTYLLLYLRSLVPQFYSHLVALSTPYLPAHLMIFLSFQALY